MRNEGSFSVGLVGAAGVRDGMFAPASCWIVRRARADLEPLVETCQVGVAVLDAAAGAPLSLNRALRRILAALEVKDPPYSWQAGGFG